MAVMHVIISHAGWQEMAQSGLSTGWLTAWLMSTGKKRVCFHHLQDDSWRKLVGAQLFIGDHAELRSVAMSHGRRLAANLQGRLQIIGASEKQFNNPERTCCYYQQGEHRVMLMPIGDLVSQRHQWLSVFSSVAQGAIHVTLDQQNGGGRVIELESGLYAFIDQLDHPTVLDDRTAVLNHDGRMPEEQLLQLLKQRGWYLRCAESCTAGGLTARIARVPGASRVLERSWITYSNTAKHELLAVSKQTLEQHGAVSEAVVKAMVEGIRGEKTLALAISGIAGPDGGSEDKPIGTVWAALAVPGSATRAFRLRLSGSRNSIQAQAAMQLIAEACISLKV